MRNLSVDTSKMIFVFGSNTGGIHGGGAARYAYEKRQARWGASYGHYGETFAIPTKGHIVVPHANRAGSSHSVRIGQTLPLAMIRRFVDGFLAFADTHPDLEFQVTCIGCGLAGLKHEDVAPMFRGFEHTGIYFDYKWEPHLQSNAKFWGEG